MCGCWATTIFIYNRTEMLFDISIHLSSSIIYFIISHVLNKMQAKYSRLMQFDVFLWQQTKALTFS